MTYIFLTYVGVILIMFACVLWHMCYTCLGYIHMGYIHVILHYALLHITDTVHTKTQDAALYLLQHVPVSVVAAMYSIHCACA